MNKKGFTMVELMAVIVILAMITLIAIPAIQNIQSSVLQKTYDSKVTKILAAAKDYAYDNLSLIKMGNTDTSCTDITVGYLINQGYIPGDNKNKTEISNPITNESMNDMVICLRFTGTNANDRKLYAAIKGE